MSQQQDKKTITKGRSRIWTKQEDHILVTAVGNMAKCCWKQVSQALGGRRTADQCCQRWHRILSPKAREGKWTSEEDSLLMAAVERLGLRAWRAVADCLAPRSELQCRLRHAQLSRRANPVFHNLPFPGHSLNYSLDAPSPSPNDATQTHAMDGIQGHVKTTAAAAASFSAMQPDPRMAIASLLN